MKLKGTEVLALSRAVEIRDHDIDCSKDVPITKQEFKDDCDINVIVERCLRAGVPLPAYESITPVFADVSEIGDYRSILHRLQAADEAFMGLDPKIRSRFENDPGKLIAFLGVESNRKEAIELGLVKPSDLPDGSKSFVDSAGKVTVVPPVSSGVTGSEASK